MAISGLRNRVVLGVTGIAFGVIPLISASPAFATPISTSLTVGPAVLPQVPVSACIDTTCVATPTLTSVQLTATATVDGSITPVVLTPEVCPNGGLGVAVRVTTTQTLSVTLSADVSGTTPSGSPVDISVGPKTETITAGTPGALISACTD
ncbi:hypothetical protein [Streptomyces sp. NK08204]|uniref:hypothetical protein n=1 Tax=Streptomyces sp. NK08204 TaxID=2873260 RepID=UPI001CED2B43|nr:hypothetical protein [Streptomyces sp. NK08204]